MTSEAEIEASYVVYAMHYGVLAVKFIDPCETGAPDRINFCPGGYVFFIEFKKPKEVPNAKQKWYHKRLRKLGFEVHVCDNLDDAISILHRELENAKRTINRQPVL